MVIIQMFHLPLWYLEYIADKTLQQSLFIQAADEGLLLFQFMESKPSCILYRGHRRFIQSPITQNFPVSRTWCSRRKALQITPSFGSFVWKKIQILAPKQRESDSLALTYSVWNHNYIFSICDNHLSVKESDLSQTGTLTILCLFCDRCQNDNQICISGYCSYFHRCLWLVI